MATKSLLAKASRFNLDLGHFCFVAGTHSAIITRQ